MADTDNFCVERTEENIQIMVDNMCDHFTKCFESSPERDYLLRLMRVTKMEHEEEMKQYLRDLPGSTITQEEGNLFHDKLIEYAKIEWGIEENFHSSRRRAVFVGGQCNLM